MVSRKPTKTHVHGRTPADSAELVADGLMTIREVASFLRLSRSQIYVLMDEGDLCFCKIGRSRRVPKRAAVALAAKELRGGKRLSG